MKETNFESERLKALSSYDILDTSKEKEYDDLAELAKLICNTPIALITFLDDSRQWFKSCFGLNIHETKKEISFCQYTIMDDDIMVIKDAQNHPLFRDNPLVIGDPHIRFYAGAPLITPDGFRLGSVCVIDKQPRELTNDQQQALTSLARAITTNLELRRKHKIASESATQLSKTNQKLANANRLLKSSQHQLAEKVEQIDALRLKDQEQTRTFRHFIVNARDCIFNIDDTFCFSYANPITEKITGYSQEELKSIQYWQIIRDDYRDKVRKFYQDQIKGKVADSYLEFPVVSKTGKEYFLGQKVTFEFQNNKFSNLRAIARDITEKYEAENALVEKEQLLEDTHEMARMGGWEFMIFTGELILTKESYSILYLEKDETPSIKRMQQMMGKGEWAELENAFTKIRISGQPIQMEIELQCEQNNKVWVNVHGKLKYKNSLPYKIAGSIQDITQQKELEEERRRMLLRLTTIIENINGGILLENEHREIVLVNNQFCNMFQIPVPPEKMIGLDCSDAAENSRHLMKNPDEFVMIVKEILQNRLPVYNEEVYFEDGRITERDYLPLFIGNEYVGHLWIYRDITWKKKHELELTKAKKEAEEAASIKENFLSTMSHEIRTPLNAVLGITQLLMKQEPVASQKKHLNLLKFSADNLMALINDILDYSKIESENLQLENLPFELPGLMHGIAETFEFKTREKQIFLQLKLDDNLPKMVMGDQIRLGQVLINLVSNAVKFTHKGGITLKVECLEDDWYNFQVIDTGIGIDEQHLKKIFERFTQAEKGINRRYGGTGLGLAISKRLVEMMNGQLKVSSKQGEGSCFAFQIKLPATSEEVIASGNQEVTGLKYADLKVLVVEDNEINMFVAVSFLEMLGITADKAQDGEQGLKKILNEYYDLVLLDLQMPDKHGYEVTAEVRAQPDHYYKNLPIVALTATSTPNLRQEVLQYGMNGYLPKPFEMEELQQLIRNLALSPDS